MQKKGEIESFVENHTTSTVSFTVNMKSVQLSRMKKSGIEKVFKLESNISTNNMHAFDHKNNIQKYASPEEIVDAYFPIRMGLYHERKSVLEYSKEYEAALIRNKARFIENVVDGKISLVKGGKTKQDTIHELLDQNFVRMCDLQKILSRKKSQQESKTSNVTTNMNEEDGEDSKQFDYLLNMSLSSLTSDRVESLVSDASKTEKELMDIQNATPESLWNDDLNKLETYLQKTIK